jgi:4-hydroxybutyrate dehydrogenase
VSAKKEFDGIGMINYLTEIHFGNGCRRELASLLAQHGVERPLLVTDRGLCDLGLPNELNIEFPATFSEVLANPDEASVRAGVARYQAADCDGIVALGGGSPIDCAKGIGLMTTHPGPLEQYAVIRGGLSKITADKPPLFVLPTTAGTGSEVGRGALLITDRGHKLGIISPHMIPLAAICDPELTLGMPPWLTAATGLDAISHCVETFCSPKFNPVADAIAIDGLARAVTSLPLAVADGTLVEPRGEMLMASLQGGLTFQKGLGMIHSLSHPMGSLTQKRLHHGTLNAIFLSHVLQYNFSSCPEKMERMAAAVGCANTDKLPDFFRQFCDKLGLPTTLADIGVGESDFVGIAAAAMEDHSTASNPRAMTAEDCQRVLEAAR